MKVNGQPKSTPEHAIPIIRGSRESSPVPPQSPVAKLSASKGIKDGWLPGYALPVISKARSKSVNTEAASIANRSSTSPTETTPRTTSPTGKGPAGSAKARLPPPVLPKSKYQRPRSMIVTTSPSDSLYENPEETFSSFIASAPKAKAGPPNEYDALLPAAETTPSALKLRRTSSPPQILQQKVSVCACACVCGRVCACERAHVCAIVWYGVCTCACMSTCLCGDTVNNTHTMYIQGSWESGNIL